MKVYFDSSVLVAAIVKGHPKHGTCAELLEHGSQNFTCAHSLAEIFGTLTGTYKIPNETAAQQVLQLRGLLDISVLTVEDYQAALLESRQRGVMGAGIYDSLHAVFARRRGAKQIITLNPTDFIHVAPDLEIVTPQ